jgi:uncharacterized Zn-binding protein involved in type VI secretion
MPGKPAARIGDQTAHGGVISGPGCPTVLIGGKPASVMGDMHTCPAVNPGVPPPPHVGGSVMATAVMVLIGGKPAARMGDTVICTGPPSSIIVGCPTVLIGDAGGGGGGGGAGGKSGKAKVQTAATEVAENHYLDVSFEDKGGKPIGGVKYQVKTPDGKTGQGPLVGQVKKSGLPEGDCEIQLIAVMAAEWSTESAKVGDTVTLKAKTTGIESGEKATLEIYIKDAKFADHMLTGIDTKVDGDKIEAEWELEIDEALLEDQEGKEKQGGYSSPLFYFIAKAGGAMARSGLLKYKDYIELELKDKEDKPIGGAGYKVFLQNGEIRSGTLDKDGYAKVEKVPPGWSRVTYDVRQAGE